ncbi:nucleotide kinase domain-containing protein [Acinetobacter sp. WCHA45]|uniref:nucleotide kinase domain-containing protein n=1 Tax=Acinetobacter sp. WCHA45 TaxID=2004644 RepID=UPI001D17E21A|nr:nucleotide kinase domain-containing protein [Acinetobacter sp. WCHA45]
MNSFLDTYYDPQTSNKVEYTKKIIMDKSQSSLSPLKQLKTSPVYDTYWRFAAERQKIYFDRLDQQPTPWTSDPIIQVHKFTNAYRAADRVSQFLIKHVIYREDLPATNEEVFFRIMLFKFFNKIETWQLLESSLGCITFKDYSFDRYDTILKNEMLKGKRIYSAAYIMPPGKIAYGYAQKHQNHLKLLEAMMSDKLVDKIAKLKKMQRAFELIKSYPTIGDFLAYQFITDINYSEITDFSEMDFVIPGPGAKDGLRKCFKHHAGLSEPELIRVMADYQEEEFERLNLNFKSLWGRRLQLIDCQNLFCEVDKYSRLAHPEIAGISGRTRIKQKYVSTGPLQAPWFPPKWDINTKIDSYLRGNGIKPKIFTN